MRVLVARGVRISWSKLASHSPLAGNGISNSFSTSDHSPERSTEIHVELISILKTLLEKKSVKVLNDIKKPKTPWEVYDVATSIEYEMVKRNGHPVPIHLSQKMKKSIIRLDRETPWARLAIYERFRDEEILEDALTLMRLERQESLHLKTVEMVKKMHPNLDTISLKDAIGHHVLGPKLELDSGFSESRVEEISKGNQSHGLGFGQNFVIDLDLPYEMVAKEKRSLHSQIGEVYRVNRWLWEPFNIHLCGYKSDNLVMKDLVTSIDNYVWNVTPECFTRVFPKEQLVYLSPDSPHVLTEYSHDDIYILGALIDKRIPKKYTYDKAQRLGIRSARLDMKFFEFTRQKPPYFAFSDVFNVMVDARDTNGNWFYAFQNLITGRKKILRWRDEFEDAAPAPVPKITIGGPDSTLVVPETFQGKPYEKERAIKKPVRRSGSVA